MTFGALCRKFEKTDPATFPELLEQKAESILPAVERYVGDKRTGAVMLGSFVIGAMLADDEVAQSEYEFLKPGFEKFFGGFADFEQCKASVIAASEGVELIVEGVKDMMKELDDDVRDDFVTVCLMICAVDGKVSKSEQKWIKQLTK